MSSYADERSRKQKMAREIDVIDWLRMGTINVFGPPYGGKDEQSIQLARWLGAELVLGGKLLRGNSRMRPETKAIMEAGLLIPKADFLELIVPVFANPAFAGRPLVGTSLGRYKGEEETIIAALDEAGHALKAVVLLHVSEATALRRWEQRRETGEQRADDDPSAVALRFSEYQQKTTPVIETYRELDLVVDIDGEGTIDEVASLVLEGLHSFAISRPL